MFTVSPGETLFTATSLAISSHLLAVDGTLMALIRGNKLGRKQTTPGDTKQPTATATYEKRQTPKQTRRYFASLDTSWSPNLKHCSLMSRSSSPPAHPPPPAPAPNHPHPARLLSEPPKCFFPRFIFRRPVCSQAGGGGGGVGVWGV